MTNGYTDTVVAALEARLAWLQPTTKGYDVVSDANRVSLSGRYFNDDSFFAGLTVEHIYDAQPDAKKDEDDFNTYLVQLRKSNVLAALHAVFDAPQFVESGLVFRKIEQSVNNPISNNGNFVGIRLRTAGNGFGVMLNNAYLLLNGAKTFPLYLFHSQQNGTDTISNVVTDVTYIKKWMVTAKANTLTPVSLQYTLDDAVKDGVWFLGYFQSDLGTVKALDFNPAANCYNIFNGVSFESKATGVDFDRQTYGQSAGSYGLNLECTAFTDLSQQIINSAHLFDNLQGLMMAAKVIELITQSVRVNAMQRVKEEQLGTMLAQLEGVRTDTGQFIPGIRTAISKEVQRIKDAFYKPQKNITITNPNLCYGH